MEPGGGAFGGAKAGAAAQDPMAFLRKPSVVFRIGALVGGYTGYNSGYILTSMSRLLGLSILLAVILATMTMMLQLLSVLMFAMISNQAWQPNMEGQEYCIINNSGTHFHRNHVVIH